VHRPEDSQFDRRHGRFHSADDRTLDNPACSGAAAA